MLIDAAFEKQLEREDLYYWTKKYRTVKGHPWSFGVGSNERTYLKKLYRDKSKNIIIVKGRQTEQSEHAVNRALQFCSANPKTTLLYTFPSADLCATFGNQRVKDAIFDSRGLYEQLVDDGNSLTKKFKNGSYFYLRTAYGGGDKARSIAADYLICDEYQDFDNRSTSDVPARDVLLSNLDHSEYKYSHTFGTPKIKDVHFEKLWEGSTQNHWHVVCASCQHHQVLKLTNIINFDSAWESDRIDTVYYGCTKCKAPLDRSLGYWKPLHPSAEHLDLKGYHISQLMVPWKSATDIISAHGTRNVVGKTMRGFYNEVMGQFYAGSDQPLNEEVLELCYDTDLDLWDASSKSTYMGIDWGNTSTVCIIDYDHEQDIATVVHAIKLPQTDCDEQLSVLYDLIPRFRVETVVADIGYGRYECGKLIQKFPGRAWACQYSHAKEPTLIDWEPKSHTVKVDRNQSLDRLVDRAERGKDRAGGLVIPRNPRARYVLPEFLQEMKNVVAVVKHNRTEYERIGSGDHFTHALNYAIIAASKRTTISMYQPRSQSIRTGGSAMIRGASSGFRPGATRRPNPRPH